MRLRGVDGRPMALGVTGDDGPEAEPECGLVVRGEPFEEAALFA